MGRLLAKHSWFKPGFARNELTLIGIPFRLAKQCYGVFQCTCGKKECFYLHGVVVGKTKRCRACSGKVGKHPFSQVAPGRQFGQVTVLGVPFRKCRAKGQKVYICVVQCSCGERFVTPCRCLSQGETKTCGCRKRVCPPSKTHGESGTKLYRVWRGMHERCTYEKHKTYDRYGGRGIYVCDEWKNYETFRDWAMEHGYISGKEVDRIDNDGPYSPDNCRLVTHAANSRNRKRVLLIEAFGEVKTSQEWVEDARCCVSRNTIQRRIAKGIHPERAITEAPS